MKISIIHPSYGRAEQAAKTAAKWISNSASDIEYILSLSIGDPQFNNYKRLLGNPGVSKVKIIGGYKANMVIQLNAAAKLATGDLLIAVFDDFDCLPNWDGLLLKELEGKEDYVVKTDDGLRHEQINSAKLMTLPIMDRKRYEALKYIYHPAYNHFFADEELYAISERDGKLITLPILFEHLHYIVGKSKEDATNRKNNRFFQKDKATFNRRKEKNFGL